MAPDSAARRQQFYNRLGDSWRALADVLDVPAADQDRFERGWEARDLWRWLARRGRLSELADALTAVDRPDLAGLVTSPGTSAATDGPVTTHKDSAATEGPPPRRDRVVGATRALAVGAGVGLLLGGVVTFYLVDDRRSHSAVSQGEAPSGSSPTASATSVSPTPQATPWGVLESPPFEPYGWIAVNGTSVTIVPDRSAQADYQIAWDEVAPMSPAKVDIVLPGGRCLGEGGGRAVPIDTRQGGTVCGTTKTGLRIKMAIRPAPSDPAKRLVVVTLL